MSSIDRDRSTDGLQDLPTPAAQSLAEHLGSIFGATARAILHYGSQAQGRASRPDCAFDFFVIVTNYHDAYRAVASGIGTTYRPGLAIALARVLPPNVISIRQRGPFGEREAKCVIISDRDFRRECSSHARDHFVQARLAQRVILTWSLPRESADEVLQSVRAARDRSFDWVRAFLRPRFDLAGYCRTLLEVSLAHEIRPEARNHSEVLFAAQRETLLGIYGPVLGRLVERGVLEREGDQYRQTQPPGAIARLLVRNYFQRSKVRATLRLLKHPFLYDNWLAYIADKIDRSTGQKIELTDRERRRPLIFLWPRVFRYLRTRPQRQH